MPTTPYSALFASVTKTLPGPHTRSTFGTDSVPYAMAATACAPPMPNTRLTPARSAATSIAGSGRPFAPGGVQTITSSTPATRAGMVVISTVEASPRGTYAPTLAMGTSISP